MTRRVYRCDVLLKDATLTVCSDGAADNAWPADIDNNTFADITDIAYLTGVFGSAVPPASPRLNLAPDPLDGFVDITDIVTLTGLFGNRCN
jgi:hypothetical protein